MSRRAEAISVHDAGVLEPVDEAGASAAPPWAGWLAFVLSLAGLGDSSYLTYEHFADQIPPCPTHGLISCLKVTNSPESHVFGIPVALLGLVYYVVVTAINLPPLWRLWDRRIHWARLGLAVMGIGMVIYLLVAELFLIKAICLWCTGVHIVTFLLFVLVVSFAPAMLAAAGGGWGEPAPRR